jgi:hypothetical protein
MRKRFALGVLVLAVLAGVAGVAAVEEVILRYQKILLLPLLVILK